MASLQRTGYETVRPTHQCAETQRRFQPGEAYVATLTDNPDNDEMIRLDFGLEAWERGARPPRAPIAVWRTVESDGQPQQNLLPGADELFAMFEGMDDEAEGRGAVFRYLLALMLMRKRVLRLVDQRVGKTGRPVLQLAKRGGPKGAPPEMFDVTDPGMDEDAIAAGIQELGTVLGSGDAPDGGEA
ncbi:MAG: hypothetical protein ACF8R9_14210 [Phycisphaerales bacterium JB054]